MRSPLLALLASCCGVLPSRWHCGCAVSLAASAHEPAYQVDIGPDGQLSAVDLEDSLQRAEADLHAARSAAKRLLIRRHGSMALAQAHGKADVAEARVEPMNDQQMFPEGWFGWLRTDDVFGDEFKQYSQGFFTSAPRNEWLFLTGCLCSLLLLDASLLRRVHSTRGGSLVLVSFWIFTSLLYGAHYMLVTDFRQGCEWLLGYLLEVILSIDNVFVFYIVFDRFAVPQVDQHKALFIGVTCALLLRLGLFLTVGSVVHVVKWVRVAFGFLLMYSGICATTDSDEDQDPSENALVVGLQRLLGTRLLSTYSEDGRIFVWGEDGRVHATLLLPVIVAVEVADVVFAMDSLVAKVSQIHNQFAAFSSSAFAVLAMRALFFVLRDLVDYFKHLKYGLCVILVFIGLELLAADFVVLPASALVLAISAVFAVSIISSMNAKSREESSLAASQLPAGGETARPSSTEEVATADVRDAGLSSEDDLKGSGRQSTESDALDDVSSLHEGEGSVPPPPPPWQG
eukprot:TRINITY_DN112262_c0_g1_i1.p1 TRINITY_DN112262_c0_g1~~TRINITY_DN112262_c0_g1_i1.p1  ORF type:complete len:514 (-),score=125.85 TRINITY_DN112262_c0_g1_i1:102-1643(-)